ncbi:tRNA dihydrouridine synthase DusB [Fuchsiella alkaliacetigena]|uniref:tRNA dihydrouridine synthase DusB n=1 Tax=Fuchsiella alkaliacetigena TaxID=957042 RepID=UPI00200B14E5|nr:tRNA dihydrouridine synthase DusB [Fuchsiella alkaliacetigena]MCK8824888.1 tRNA dihydrouridine synthase DusB [Fuchsiella alkaliacetigena]
MEIGNVKLDNPVILAPMAGVTDLPYRQLVKEMGCALVCMEMVSAKGLVYGSRRTKEMLTINPQERPVSLQLFGRDPEIMAEAVKIVEEYQPDIIDLNLGCPARKIVKNGAGSALMKEPQRVAEIISALVETASRPVTVKMRKGWDEDSVNAVEIALIAQKQGAQAVAVHGRTREEFYKGEADWSIIKEVSQELSIPVIGNGDIFKPQDAKQMLMETGCNGIMIGRGAQGNPWLFKRVIHYLVEDELLAAPTAQEKLKMLIKHLRSIVKYKGEDVGVRQMRKHIAWYVKGLPNCTEVKRQANNAQSQKEMERILFEYAEKLKK